MEFIEGQIPLNLVLIVDSFTKTLLNVGKLINFEKTQVQSQQCSSITHNFL